jgi:ATP-dependent DNA helicase DinG
VTEDVRGAMSFEVLAPWVRSIIEGRKLVGHNLGFDVAFLEGEFERCDLTPPNLGECFDTLALARAQLVNQRSYRLTELAQSLGLEIERAHDACFDALLALDLLRFLRCHDHRG